MHNLRKQAELRANFEEQRDERRALKSMRDKVLGNKRGREDEGDNVGAKKAKKGDKSTHREPITTGKRRSKPKGYCPGLWSR